MHTWKFGAAGSILLQQQQQQQLLSYEYILTSCHPQVEE